MFGRGAAGSKAATANGGRRLVWSKSDAAGVRVAPRAENAARRGISRGRPLAAFRRGAQAFRNPDTPPAAAPQRADFSNPTPISPV